MILPRLYPILDVGLLEARGCPVDGAAEAIFAAGAGILQWRCKRNPGEADMLLLERVVAACRRGGARLIVNDRADIARMFGSGLHLGQDDLPAAAARRVVGSEASIGLSTHNEEQVRAAAAEPVDYIAIGPVFSTVSKQNPDPVVGLGNLRAWSALTSLPVVAIGGITTASARDVLDHGAASVAVIGGLYPDPCTPASIERRVKEWLNLLCA